MIKKLGFFSAPLIIMGAGALMTAGCDKASDITDDVCGECGEFSKGDIGISGNAKIDGFLQAVSSFDTSVTTLNAKFEVGLSQLEAAFGIEVDGSASLDARVTALIAKIEGEVNANLEADSAISVGFQPAKCSANLDVAVEAQVTCEAKADCDVEVEPGSAQVTCEGTCTGSCSGECDGTVQCKVEAPSVECSGSCEGSCDVEVSAECSGTCKGSCDGECSAYVKNADGEMECNGSCSGKCEGTCSASVSGSCEGKCTGSCTADPGGAECKGEVKCEGTCKAECSGGCTGEVTPPSAKASCDASAECKGQAKAQASASLECTPPSVDLTFAYKANLSAEAKASFEAKIGQLKVSAPLMLEALAKNEALFTGKVDGEVVFDPTPIATIEAGLNGVISAGADGSLFADIPAGKIPCALTGMSEAVDALAKVGGEATGKIATQAKFFTAFTSGFKG
jgi:modification target Cys-rich repeat protein